MEYNVVIQCAHEDGFTSSRKLLIDSENNRQAYKDALNLARRFALQAYEEGKEGFVSLESVKDMEKRDINLRALENLLTH